jgi:hypothetical protein
MKEYDLGFLLGGCTKISYNSIQNLKQVRLSSEGGEVFEVLLLLLSAY